MPGADANHGPATANVDQFLTPDYVGHFSAYPTIYGLEELKKYVRMYDAPAGKASGGIFRG